MQSSPADEINRVDTRLSQDPLAHLVVWIILASIAIYYGATKGFHGGDALKLAAVLSLVALQSITRYLPITKNWEFFNSGGTGALMLYNTALVLMFLWFIPLYSPFILIIPAVMFITIYYRGTVGFLLSSFFLVLAVLADYHQFGLPKAEHARYYPFLTIALGEAYALAIQRISYFDSKIRAEFHKASDKVLVEREQLNSLINSMADAVVATDVKGNILFYNGAAANLLNTNTNLVGQPFADYFNLYDKSQNSIDLLGLARRENRNFETEDYSFITNTREQIALYLDIAPIRSNYGDDTRDQNGFIILIRDITKKKSLDEERNEFISVTSHELRTPLAVAEANLSMALKTSAQSMDADGLKRLQQAYSNVVFLAELVNDLSTLARAENNALRTEMEMVDPKKIVAQVVEDYHEQATKKNLQLIATVADTVQPIYSSTLYLREILQNLISNAIKYTAAGSITVTVEQDETKGLVVRVQDTGIGLSVTDKAKVFNKYFRSEDFRTRETRGTGLGLYITYKLVQYLQGKIWLESELNKGSSFYVQLPVIAPKPTAAAVSNQS